LQKNIISNHIANDPLKLETTTADKIENKLITFVCDNTDCILDPLDQIKYSLNEVQLTYGSVVVLKDAP
jgi:hypothetical protein